MFCLRAADSLEHTPIFGSLIPGTRNTLRFSRFYNAITHFWTRVGFACDLRSPCVARAGELRSHRPLGKLECHFFKELCLTEWPAHGQEMTSLKCRTLGSKILHFKRSHFLTDPSRYKKSNPGPGLVRAGRHQDNHGSEVR